MSANENATMYESVPVVSELNKVQGFDPLKFLRRTGKGERNLDLKYKKLWFRLKYPNGRIKLSALKITDKLAIIEARVYFDKNDTQPKASFIAQRDAESTPGGLYIESAQHAAIDRALSDAGFGVQFTVASSESTESVPQVVKEEQKAAEVTPAAEVKSNIETVIEGIPEAAAEEVAVKMEEKATDEAEGEEVEEEAPASGSAAPAYTSDMPVEDICSLMTYEEACNVIVPTGTCKDWTLAQVADRRPASLKWYINGYNGDDNILRAAAAIMQSTLDTQKAS